jgi:hypothetical protein
MDENRLDAIAYPTTRRIAPRIGGNQIGTNAALSAQTGFPAITVPAGSTPSGFPVGIELLGRRFAEPTLIGLAYSYEQSTRHRRPPSTTPPLGAAPPQSAHQAPRFSPERGALTFEATAKGQESDVPVPFDLMGRFTFNSRTRQLGYDVRTSGASPDEIAGIYLHRRTSRINGGVAYILSKASGSPTVGAVTLTEGEAADLVAGKFYIAAMSTKSPRLSVRANLALPTG